jgi:hypothetical protein
MRAMESFKAGLRLGPSVDAGIVATLGSLTDNARGGERLLHDRGVMVLALPVVPTR